MFIHAQEATATRSSPQRGSNYSLCNSHTHSGTNRVDPVLIPSQTNSSRFLWLKVTRRWRMLLNASSYGGVDSLNQWAVFIFMHHKNINLKPKDQTLRHEGCKWVKRHSCKGTSPFQKLCLASLAKRGEWGSQTSPAEEGTWNDTPIFWCWGCLAKALSNCLCWSDKLMVEMSLRYPGLRPFTA